MIRLLFISNPLAMVATVVGQILVAKAVKALLEDKK